MKKTILITWFLLLSVPAFASSLGRATIVNQSFTVAAGEMRFWSFAVHPLGGRVYGRFRSEGGSGSDIECLILDEDSFENYRTGHTVNTFYNSGRVTVARLNVRLSEGRYYLVFNNRFSVVTPKAVGATVHIELPLRR